MPFPFPIPTHYNILLLNFYSSSTALLNTSVVSNSVRPHRWQSARLPRPWDSPGKSTGVGWHFFLQCMKVKSESEVAKSYLTLSDPMDCSLPGSSIHGILQARVLEWGAIAFSNSSSKPNPNFIHYEAFPDVPEKKIPPLSYLDTVDRISLYYCSQQIVS